MKKFLAGVASLYAYDQSDNLLFSSKTMLDSSIDISTSNTEVRGGQGDVLQFVYFHTSKFNITATETQWNLGFFSVNAGSPVVTGANVWTEESVTLGSGGAGTVVGTPIVTSSGNIYGWVTDSAGNTTRITFTGSNFTLSGGTSGQVVTVRYYQADAAATQVTISGNFIPSVVRLVLDAQLFSSSGGAQGGSSKIGNVLIEVPNAQLTGAQKIDLKSSGVSNTPLALSAVADVNNNYATITEVITNSHWYDQVYALAATVDPITVSTGTPATIDLRAIPVSGNAFKPPYADITFTSSDVTKATVSSSGVVTKVATGSCTIECKITAKTSVLTNVDVTVS